MSVPWRGEDRQNSLPGALEGAVGDLQALLEPTPEQLAASYQRVRQTLARLPPPQHATAADNDAAPAGWRRIAADCRRAAWAISSGAALALLAGFALGRLGSGAAAPEAAAPVVASSNADPTPLAVEPPASPAPPAIELERPGEPAAPEAHPVTQELAATRAPDPALPRAPAPRRARRADNSGALNQGPCQRPDSVQRAECWLRREQPRKALQALCGARPGEEREREQMAMLKLVAECKLGRDVRGRAQRFFTEWPDSPLALRIRNECPGVTSRFSARAKSALAN